MEKAECVIAMLGQKFPDRKREALSLIEKGVAVTLLIPAWRQVIGYGGGNLKSSEKVNINS